MSDSTLDGFCNLPTELQRQIFLQAAIDDPASTVKLILVARRVCEWLQPIIYRMVTIGAGDGDLFIRTLTEKPPDFFHANVKHLCLTRPAEVGRAKRVLEVCKGVAHLALWVDVLGVLGPGSVASLVATLPLQRLSIECRHFLDIFSNPSALPPIWYRSLTHLELVFWDYDEAPPFPPLTALRSLTHLAIRGLNYWDIQEAYVASILSSFQRLKFLLIFFDESESLEEIPRSVDNRVVFLPYPEEAPVRNWEAIWRGTSTIWLEAEEEIERRMEEEAKAVSLEQAG
ncbi:hypothetical protein FA15DRAFT_755274 [Coprinopsis marcescibilis]|uniref:F-box domain-containing protein n=1 Tax=Coprinopsis marcescibilis TaxID=230819 RepID=A0A5C3L1L8_COPMA|nr:hypothetical protein FA15DRAFT_755274 [Coprinopsis marcescibilis]